jgi:hypothetical protein
MHSKVQLCEYIYFWAQVLPMRAYVRTYVGSCERDCNSDSEFAEVSGATCMPFVFYAIGKMGWEPYDATVNNKINEKLLSDAPDVQMTIRFFYGVCPTRTFIDYRFDFEGMTQTDVNGTRSIKGLYNDAEHNQFAWHRCIDSYRNVQNNARHAPRVDHPHMEDSPDQVARLHDRYPWRTKRTVSPMTPYDRQHAPWHAKRHWSQRTCVPCQPPYPPKDLERRDRDGDHDDK